MKDDNSNEAYTKREFADRLRCAFDSARADAKEAGEMPATDTSCDTLILLAVERTDRTDCSLRRIIEHAFAGVGLSAVRCATMTVWLCKRWGDDRLPRGDGYWQERRELAAHLQAGRL